MDRDKGEAFRRGYINYMDTHDRVNCYFDKGTKERIKKLGYSVSDFIKLAVAEKMERENKG